MAIPFCNGFRLIFYFAQTQQFGGDLLALPSAVAAQTTVPLEIADGGYLYVRARVADGVDARLLLDTGAGINTLSESILGRLGDRVRDAGTHTGT